MASFRARIEEAAYAYPVESCRLVRVLSNAKCPARLIHDFAVNMIRMADGFPAMLARLLAITPHPALRAILLENMFEEEGLEIAPAGMRAVPGRRHADIARKFGLALGIGVAEIGSGHTPSYVWLAEAIAQGDWQGAFAYLNIGMEANNARLMGPLYEALRLRGLTDDALEFFVIHGPADIVHSNRSIDVATLIARTPEQQQHVLDAVARGARVFWELNN